MNQIFPPIYTQSDSHFLQNNAHSDLQTLHLVTDVDPDVIRLQF